MANSQYYGTRGDSVKEWQKKLNALGAGLAVDGIWGPKTEAAYNQYGIQTNAAQTTAASASTMSPLDQAIADLTAFQAQKPGDYTSEYGDQIQSILDQIQSRQPFNYDFNADPLYNQYKGQYQKQGKLAMQDTIGQAAALTGGYGNSYGQTAGQQVYNQYLQSANDIIPDLQNAALQRYTLEGDTLQQNLSNLQGLDESDYARYRDETADYYNELEYLYNLVQDAQAQANYEQEWDYATSKSSGGSKPKSTTPASEPSDDQIFNAVMDMMGQAPGTKSLAAKMKKDAEKMPWLKKGTQFLQGGKLVLPWLK